MAYPERLRVNPPSAAGGKSPWTLGGRSIAFLLSSGLLNEVAIGSNVGRLNSSHRDERACDSRAWVGELEVTG